MLLSLRDSTGVLYIFWILTPYETSFTNIFSHSVGGPFVLLMVPFAVQKLFSLM